MTAKPQSDEYKAFESLLGKVLSVSKSELQERLEKEKREKGPKGRASRASVSLSKRD